MKCTEGGYEFQEKLISVLFLCVWKMIVWASQLKNLCIFVKIALKKAVDL